MNKLLNVHKIASENKINKINKKVKVSKNKKTRMSSIAIAYILGFVHTATVLRPSLPLRVFPCAQKYTTWHDFFKNVP